MKHFTGYELLWLFFVYSFLGGWISEKYFSIIIPPVTVTMPTEQIEYLSDVAVSKSMAT
jgi:hypothetical protein